MKQHSQTFKSHFYFPDNFKVDEIITKKNNARDSIFLRFKTKKLDRGNTFFVHCKYFRKLRTLQYGKIENTVLH